MNIPHFSTLGAVVSGTGTTTTTSSTTSSSSSSSGGAAGTSFWSATYAYDAKELTSAGPYVKDMKKGQRVKLKVNGETHHVGVISVGSNSVTLNVSSTPQQMAINVGEEKKVNVNTDNYYDLLIKLISVKNSTANVSISGIHEEMPKTQNTTKVGGSSITAGQNSTSNQTTGSEKNSEGGSSLGVIKLILVVLAIIVVLGFVVWFVMSKKNINHAHSFYVF